MTADKFLMRHRLAGGMVHCVLGVDIGTSSSKGILVTPSGDVVATASIGHDVVRPHPGWVEMDPRVWWEEFTHLVRELTRAEPTANITAVGVSGMGPCVLLTDQDGRPVRPAILYGVDTRASHQIETMTRQLGEDQITAVGGSPLTSQSAGPKIAWVADEEADRYARARRLFMPASWLVYQLTGAYVLDHQSASQATPLYNLAGACWHAPYWERFAPHLQPPTLRWAGQLAGHVTPEASAATGVATDVPVITGTIDAWAEAVSVGAHRPGDLMLMYGTTLFLIATGDRILRSPTLWTTAGAFAGTHNLAAGLSTAGAITAWICELTGADYPSLLAEAAASPPGANGLAMLPYFAGERTPVQDPDARGVIAGLTLGHTRGDLYRAALEATAMGVRHNLETMRAAGADIRRVVATGGGTAGRLWPQIVSDVTGLEQRLPQLTIGACLGDAFLAAAATAPAGATPRIIEWNPTAETIRPQAGMPDSYQANYRRYRALYEDTRRICHELADDQRAEPAPGSHPAS